MKTTQELLDFYGVEIGKKYKITDGKTHSSDASKFYEIGDTFSIRVYIGKAKVYFDSAGFFSLSLLDDISYEEVKDILTDEERAYLSAVIKPFRDMVEFVSKQVGVMTNQEYIKIYLRNADYAFLPFFEPNQMYKGMKVNKQYSLKELGL